jgi:hypothetical protein
LIAKRIITVLRLQGKFATNGKSRVSDQELKTVRTIDVSVVYVSERSPVIIRILNVNFFEFKDGPRQTLLLLKVHNG